MSDGDRMRPRASRFGLLAVVACVVLPAALGAQQGHPLIGIWSGDWGPTPSDRSPVLIDLSWETTTLSGTINPGFPDAATIETGSLNSTDWTVHLEAVGRDEEGPFRIIVDGQLDELGSPNRTMSGTWRRGDTTGDFELRRE